MIHVHPISSDPVIIHSLGQEIIHPHNRYVLRDTTALCLQAPYQKIRRKITVADKGIHSLLFKQVPSFVPVRDFP